MGHVWLRNYAQQRSGSSTLNNADTRMQGFSGCPAAAANKGAAT